MTSRRGFTLVEVLVALGVLSIAALALVHVGTESAATAGGAHSRLLAQIVAENRLVETIAAPDDLILGTTSGETRLGGRAWRWRQDIAATANDAITRVDVSVRTVDDDTVIAALAGFKGRR